MIKILKANEVPASALFGRKEDSMDITAVVADILKDVRENGDKAVLAYGKKFDNADIETLEVSKEEWDAAVETVPAQFMEILREAAENITAFHQNQKHDGFQMQADDGVILGQRVMPLKRVGLYVPGGTASYPSSVLMNCLPAKIAGVQEILMVTPAKNGQIPADILAAAKVAGVDRIFKTGGAQAVAALAYGTESIPQVDKIVGPGNAFVAEAKRQVYGLVDIDMIAGPSEILVVADGNTNPRFAAADLLSQAEHDKLASAVLITDSEPFAKAVAEEIEVQLEQLPRKEIARASIDDYGKIIVCENLTSAIDVANEIAPEHLELCVDEPFEWLQRVKNAGSVFLGRYCPEALGDYFAGPNHTLPTMGTARFSSPLGVDDFVKRSAYSYYTRDALMQVADKVAYFAQREGLSAHARSATVRKEG